jgi:hypothetical protein
MRRPAGVRAHRCLTTCAASVRKMPDRVFLPFEDERLTLILSKAFLLADDARISDQSIVAQLRRSR